MKTGIMEANLELITITGYADEAFQTPFESQPYSVMTNTDSIIYQRSAEYIGHNVQDADTGSQENRNETCDKLNFDIVMDYSGSVDTKWTNITEEIDALKKIVFKYNEAIHSPNFVKIKCGKNITFKGVLVSFDISYTLFTPDGEPLRTKISLGFSNSILRK